MRLIELSSTRSLFKTVRFNRTGLSLIVGKHTEKQAKDIQSTYNGVGKSLVVALLHYCLGANKNEQFEEHLAGWDFTLTFEHGDETHRVTRTIGESELNFNGEPIKLKPYQAALTDLGVFAIPPDTPGLSFRALIKYFLRPGRSAYLAPDQASAKTTDYYRLLYTSFLLGLDFQRVIEKHDAKQKLDEQKELAQRYKKDKELREFYVGEKKAEVEMAALRERIAQLHTNLDQFTVAKDYGDRQAQANELHAKILDARNEEAILDAKLADINLALNTRPDVTPERVKKLYAEAKVALPDAVTKRLVEVEQFQERLRANRLRRLELERKNALAARQDWQKQRAGWQAELDGLLQYLKAHKALDEYTENNRFLAELIAKAKRIEDYLSLLNKYTTEAQRIRAQMGQATVQTTEYLKTAKPHLDKLMDTFRGFAREFYGDKPAGLVVQNNDGENQIRFDIDARIEHDAADGINDVRIFCFDLLVLTLRERHAVDFLFHDSRLFADMDWHQRLTLFRLAHRVCKEKGLQYIASINEDHIESTRAGAETDFERLFGKKTRILELTPGVSGSGKLLGIQVEMKYGDE